MLSRTLQGNIIHYPVYLSLSARLFPSHLFLPWAAHATPTYSITSPGFLTPGSLIGSILSLITNTVFIDAGLFCCYCDPYDLCLSFCFAPSGHRYCLSPRLSSCWMTGDGGGRREKKKKIKPCYSLQSYFWLPHKSHAVCLFCWITVCLASLNLGADAACENMLETNWCKHLATNEHKHCQCSATRIIEDARPK